MKQRVAKTAAGAERQSFLKIEERAADRRRADERAREARATEAPALRT